MEAVEIRKQTHWAMNRGLFCSWKHVRYAIVPITEENDRNNKVSVFWMNVYADDSVVLPSGPSQL